MNVGDLNKVKQSMVYSCSHIHCDMKDSMKPETIINRVYNFILAVLMVFTVYLVATFFLSEGANYIELIISLLANFVVFMVILKSKHDMEILRKKYQTKSLLNACSMRLGMEKNV